jgi:shikimate kinase
MMGSGKSTIGKRLAYKLNLQFYDSDRLIEEREGLSVVDIFDFRGEEYFKKKESEIIKEILGYGSVVLSTGGESFFNDEVREVIKQSATSIWLKTSIEVLHERVSRRNTRPQLTGENKMELIEEMVSKSYPIFEKADIIIESTDMEAHFVVDTIISKLKTHFDES